MKTSVKHLLVQCEYFFPSIKNETENFVVIRAKESDIKFYH